MKRFASLLMAILLLAGSLAACRPPEDLPTESEDTLPPTEAPTEAVTIPIPPTLDPEGVPMDSIVTYQNPLLTCRSESAWPGYGFGDPFVMRYNGVYYLYVSTKDGSVGIKCWSSTDLVNWKSEGFCTSDKITTGKCCQYSHTDILGRHISISKSNPCFPCTSQ